MAIISRVEGRSLRGRLVFAAIFLLLGAGGLTTLYPFAIMIAGSTRSTMDQADLGLLPDFLVHRDMLYRKFLETKYNQNVLELNSAHQQYNLRFEKVPVPEHIVQRRIDDLKEFAAQADLPTHWQVVGGIAARNKIPLEAQRQLQDRLRARYNDDLAAFGREAGTPLTGWTRAGIQVPAFLSQQFDFPRDSPIYQEYLNLTIDTPLADRQLLSISGSFLDQVVYPKVGKDAAGVAKFNSAHPGGPVLSSFETFVLPPTVPPATQPKFRAEWVEFVHRDLHPSFVVLQGVPTLEYERFLSSRYEGKIDELNRLWHTSHPSFAAIPLPDGRTWLHAAEGRDYLDFLITRPPEQLQLVGTEYAWRRWLADRYGGDVQRLNTAHETHYAAFDQAALPVDQLEWQYVQANAGSIRWQHATRNYAVVLRELLTQGRPFMNTLIVCGATVLLTILINPLAAYAMSRFKLPGTYKILLLLMVTSAFPPMVVMVPKFLILRQTGLLNTYAALIIPFLANGYLIFLLKGFFDSLPETLYEAALIDGAGEMRMFFEITMALSKPILAVVALQAFAGAYSMFLYAMIVCPRPEMWTLNVWLYQWQTNVPMPGVFAALLISAIPTLLIFLLAQNVIMKGIVVPVEK